MLLIIAMLWLLKRKYNVSYNRHVLYCLCCRLQ